MRIPTAPGHVVLALNKPRGVHSTMSDDRGRPCVGDYLQRTAGAALPRRSARRRHRGAAAAHERRRPGPATGPPVARRAQDVPGAGQGLHRARPRPAPARGDRARGRDRPGRPVQGGDVSPRPGTRRGGPARGPQARGPPAARRRRAPGRRAGPGQGRTRSGSATSGPARCGPCRSRRSASCTPRSASDRPPHGVEGAGCRGGSDPMRVRRCTTRSTNSLITLWPAGSGMSQSRFVDTAAARELVIPVSLSMWAVRVRAGTLVVPPRGVLAVQGKVTGRQSGSPRPRTGPPRWRRRRPPRIPRRSAEWASWRGSTLSSRRSIACAT